MRRVAGFAIFSFALGMMFMLILSSDMLGFFLIILLLLIGYHLYCC